MDDLPETSVTLIGRVCDPSDEEAWRRFAGLYRPIIIRMAKRRGLQESDAEDVAQRVLMGVSRAIHSFEVGPDKPPFRAWLSRIATNAILNALSRKPPDRGTGDSDVGDLLAKVPDNRADQNRNFCGKAKPKPFGGRQQRFGPNSAPPPGSCSGKAL